MPKDCFSINSINIKKSNIENSSSFKNDQKNNDLKSSIIQNTIRPVNLQKKVKMSLFSKNPAEISFSSPKKEEQNVQSDQNRNELFSIFNEIHENKYT